MALMRNADAISIMATVKVLLTNNVIIPASAPAADARSILTGWVPSFIILAVSKMENQLRLVFTKNKISA